MSQWLADWDLHLTEEKTTVGLLEKLKEIIELKINRKKKHNKKVKRKRKSVYD